MGNSLPSEWYGATCGTCGKSLKGIGLDWRYHDNSGVLHTFSPPGGEQYYRREGQGKYECETCFRFNRDKIPTECYGATCGTCGKSLKGIGRDWRYHDNSGVLHTFSPPGGEQYYRREGQGKYECETCFRFNRDKIPTECYGATCGTCGKSLKGIGRDWRYHDNSGVLHTFSPPGGEQYYRREGQGKYECQTCSILHPVSAPAECNGANCVTCSKELKGIGETWEYIDHTGSLYTFTPPGAECYYQREGQDYYQCETCFIDPNWKEKQDRAQVIVDHNIQQTDSVHRAKRHSKESKPEETDSRQGWVTFIQDAGDVLSKEAVSEILKGICKYPELFNEFTFDQINSFNSALGHLLVDWRHTNPSDVPIEVFHWIHVFLTEQYFDYNQFDLSAAEKVHIHHMLASMFSSVVSVRELVEVTTCAYQIYDTNPLIDIDDSLYMGDSVAAGFIHLLLSERFSETAEDEAQSRSEWPQAACMALVNILVEPPQKDKYNYREALSKLVNGKTWKPMEVVELLLSIQTYVKSDDNNLPTAMEQLIASQSGPTLTESGTSVSEILNEKGSSYLLQSINENAHEVENVEKDIDAICREMKEHEMADETLLDRAKVEVLSVLQKLEDHGYPDNLDNFSSFSPGNKSHSSILVSICCAVKKTEGYWPRPTQILSCILLYMAERDFGRFIEVATGEGKSCIIAMFAVVLALSGKDVDVVTSSPLLVRRDCDEWKTFYELCGLSVSNNVNADDDSGRQTCYKANIVYGTVGSFAADILRQEFHLRQTRENRDIKRSAMIADEVDFMLLDRGVQFTYLSDKTLGMHHLEPIFATIWAIVSRFTPIRVEGEEYFHEKSMPFHKSIESIIQPGLKVGVDKIREFTKSAGIFEKFPETVEQGRSNDWLSNISTGEMVKFFQAAKEVLQRDLQIYEMQEIQGKHVPVNVTTFVDDPQKGNCPTSILVLDKGLCRVLCKQDSTLQAGIANTVKHYTSPDSDTHINVPLHLQDLVEHMIPVWVESAFQATHMTKDREYHIKEGKVLPVDFASTGVIEANKKWGDGLQQFVELKHYLQISEISLVTNYMSNLAFFKRYEPRLYGVTGTLGSTTDKEFLGRQYHVDLCHVPTHKQRKFFEEPGKTLQNETEWLSAITEEVTSEVKRVKWRKGPRASLVICEDIISAEKVEKELQGKVPGQLYLYTGKCTNGIPEKLSPGDVVVATNLAGRGTDIKVTDEVNMAGGLFVILSFLPANTRVEMQAFGRTGRNGQPGSAKLLVNYERLPPVSREHAESVQSLKMNREQLAKDKLDIMIHSEVVACSAKEELFQEYCIHSKKATQIFTDTGMGKEDKDLALMFLHDQWGQWLQMKSDDIQGMVSNPKSSRTNGIASLKSSLKGMINGVVQNIQNEDSKNIYYLIRRGNNLMVNSNFNEATKRYNAAVELDSTWASIALYNRAYCTIKLGRDNYKSSARSDLEKCLDKLQNYKEEVQITANSAHCFSTRRDSTNAKSDLQIYLEMKQQVLHSFESNVQKAIEMLDSLKENDDAEVALEPIIPSGYVDAMEKQQLKELGFQGLAWFFLLKKITPFCWSGLLVAFMGVVEVAAGIFLAAVSCGTLAFIGGALIMEGVSDIYAGIKGIYTGEFDWESWAIGKAMSIVITVATFGIGTYIAAGTKGLSLALKEVGPGLREIPSLIRSQFGAGALKSTLKSACMEAGAELVEQGTQEVIGTAVDTSAEYLLDQIEKETMSKVKEDIRQDAVSGIISKSIDFVTGVTLADKLSNNMCYEIRQQFKDTAKNIAHDYVASPEWQACVQQIATGVADGLQQMHPENKTVMAIGRSIRMFNLTDGVKESVTQTKKLLEQFKLELDSRLHKELEKQEHGQSKKVESNSDEKYLRLKTEIGDDLARILSIAIQEIWRKFFVGNVTFEVSRKLNKHVSEKTGKLLGRHKIKDSLEAGVTALHTASMPPDHTRSTEATRELVQEYKVTLSEGNEMASAMDVRLLSEKLGKRIEILKEDQNGKPLIRVGANQADNVITVAYQKPTGDREHGHYNAVVDGKLIKVENKGNDCLFQAVALARGGSLENVENEARQLKHLAARELDENPEKWGHLIAQSNQATAISKTLMMVGAGGTPVSEKDISTVMQHSQFGKRTGVECDHQPACNAVSDALIKDTKNPLAKELATISGWDPTTEKIIPGRLPSVVMKYGDHRDILTTGSSHENVAARRYITDTIVNNDVVNMFKATFLASSVDFSKLVYKHRKKVKVIKGSGKDHNNYKQQCLNVLKYWREKLAMKAMTTKQYDTLRQWVHDERYKKNGPIAKELLSKCQKEMNKP